MACVMTEKAQQSIPSPFLFGTAWNQEHRCQIACQGGDGAASRESKIFRRVLKIRLEILIDILSLRGK